MDYWSDPAFVALFGAVVIARCVLPFTILRWPLPGIIACLVLDAADQTIFQAFGYDPPFYQGYDKAMDVFYLAIAWLATMRNWASRSAWGVSRFLFFYRQVGVVAFELSGTRALLLLFPNTFEYFFIAVEAVRTRWDEALRSLRFWVLVAAAIWIFVKLPQEYWIHIAQLDVTDTIRDVPWFGPLLVVGSLGILAVGWFVVRPRLAAPDHAVRIDAGPLPPHLATVDARAEYAARHQRAWSSASAEKAVLIGLLGVVFASILPGDVSPLRFIAWTAAFVLVNAATTLHRARTGRTFTSLGASLATRFAANLTALVLIDRLVYRSLSLDHAAFYVLLFSVLVTTYDLYRPVFEDRFAEPASRARETGSTEHV